MVSGFGAVFTNVKTAGTTTISFYDTNNCIIYKIAAPPKSRGLSFAGIIVTQRDYRPVGAVVASIEVTLGNKAISDLYLSWGSDAVENDDFIYGEPQEIN